MVLTGIPQMPSPGCRRWQHKGRTSTIPALTWYGRSRSALNRADMAMGNPAQWSFHALRAHPKADQFCFCTVNVCCPKRRTTRDNQSSQYNETAHDGYPLIDILNWSDHEKFSRTRTNLYFILLEIFRKQVLEIARIFLC